MNLRDQTAPIGLGAGCEHPAIIGREQELGIVEDALERLANGHGDMIAIAGEPGIGKTSLVDAACASAMARGCRVLRGRGAEGDRDLAFGLFLDALTAADGPAEALLATLEPSCITKPKIDRYRLYRQIHLLVEDMAAVHPVVLVLDDLHWADPASEELVIRLLRQGASRFLCILARRPAQSSAALETAIARAVAEDRIAQIELMPLTARDAECLLVDAFPTSVARRLHHESGGNPFYLLELAAMAADDVAGPGGRVVGIGPVGVPDLVRTEVDRELAPLSRRARQLLMGAAITGDPFEPDLAGRAADIAAEDAVTLLDELTAAGLVRAVEAGAGRPRERFAFRQPIVGRAVYESAGLGWQIAAHRRLAEAYCEREAPVVLYADHVAESASPGDEDAVALLERAAEKAMPRRPADAARWLTAALWRLRHGTDTVRRIRLLVRLATALGAVGRTATCRATWLEALALARDEEPAVRAEVVAGMARLGRFVSGCGDVRSMLTAALEGADDEPWAQPLWLELTIDHWLAGEWDEMRRCAARARGTSGTLAAALADALHARASAEHGPLDIDALEQACAIVHSLSDDELAARVDLLACLGHVAEELGEHRDAIAHLARGLSIAHATGQELFAGHIAVSLGFAQLSIARLDAAAELAGTAIEAARRLACESLHARALALRCATHLRRGDLAAAIEAGRGADAAATAAGDPRAVAVASCWLGQAMIESGGADAGRERILADCGGAGLATLGAELRPMVYASLVEAELALECTDAAEQWVVAADAAAARRPGDALRAHAAFLLATGDPRAVDVANAAALRDAEAGRAIDAARAVAIAGRALAAQGERKRAEVLLERAHTDLERHGAVRYRDHAARDLRALGRRIARRPSQVVYSAPTNTVLTAREHDIAQLVGLGHTNRRIAGALGISERTVESHVSHIFEKLGVSSRVAIAAWTRRGRSLAGVAEA